MMVWSDGALVRRSLCTFIVVALDMAQQNWLLLAGIASWLVGMFDGCSRVCLTWVRTRSM